MGYDAEYFIKKFTAIPAEFWHTKTYRTSDGLKQCALGFCGGGLPYAASYYNREYSEIQRIFTAGGMSVGFVNDGGHKKYQQNTPKERVLAALHDLKKEGL